MISTLKMSSQQLNEFYKHKIIIFYGSQTGLLVKCSLMARETGFNPWSSHTKDSKNGTWYLLTYHSAL